MIDLFYSGSPFYMTLVTLFGIVAFVAVLRVVITISKGGVPTSSQLKSIPVAGSAAFMMGLLSQAIGMYEAMDAIQAASHVSPAIVAGGFRVSMIAPIYGLIIFMSTLAIYLGLHLTYSD